MAHITPPPEQAGELDAKCVIEDWSEHVHCLSACHAPDPNDVATGQICVWCLAASNRRTQPLPVRRRAGQADTQPVRLTYEAAGHDAVAAKPVMQAGCLLAFIEAEQTGAPDQPEIGAA